MLSATLYSSSLNRDTKDCLLDIKFNASSSVIINNEIDLILIVDCSLSMDESIEELKETLLAIYRYINSTKCNRKVNLSLITFSNDAKILYSKDTKTSFAEAVDNIYADGVTNISDALILANTILDINSKQRAIIILSDGMPNRGQFQTIDELSILSDNLSRDSVPTIKVSIGYGEKYNPELLAVLGDFSYAKDINDVREIVPSVLAQTFSSYGANGHFNFNFPHRRIVIGQNKINHIFNEQVFHLGLAVNIDEIDLSTLIEFTYDEISDEGLVKRTLTTNIIKEETIPSIIMGLYHQAACIRLIEAYQDKFKNKTATKTDVIKIQQRILSWLDSPTRDACIKRIEKMMNYKVNEYENTEFKCQSATQTTFKLDTSGYTTLNQKTFFESFRPYYHN